MPHGLRGIAHLLRGGRQLWTLLLARQLLEPARCLFELVRELALTLSTAAARLLLLSRRGAALPFEFLLLPAGELLQLLRQLVDLAIVALLLGALLHLY